MKNLSQFQNTNEQRNSGAAVSKPMSTSFSGSPRGISATNTKHDPGKMARKSSNGGLPNLLGLPPVEFRHTGKIQVLRDVDGAGPNVGANSAAANVGNARSHSGVGGANQAFRGTGRSGAGGFRGTANSGAGGLMGTGISSGLMGTANLHGTARSGGGALYGTARSGGGALHGSALPNKRGMLLGTARSNLISTGNLASAQSAVGAQPNRSQSGLTASVHNMVDRQMEESAMTETLKDFAPLRDAQMKSNS